MLDLDDSNVSPTTGEYPGRRRHTLTNPPIDAARPGLWDVSGEEKRDALRRLLAADPAIPAGLVRAEGVVVCDRLAAPAT